MAEQLNVDVRTEHGKRRVKRMRQAGSVPAILYGHGQDSISLVVPAAELAGALRHGVKLVELIGGVQDTALIREIQWDTYGSDMLHVDFVRVSADEVVEMTVVVELRGLAPGVGAGGVVEHPTHSLTIRCPATAIPEKIEVNINSLELGDSIMAGDLELPEGAELLSDVAALVVQCVEPLVPLDDDEESTDISSVEPDVIGRTAEDEGSSED